MYIKRPLFFWLDQFLDSRAEIYQVFAIIFGKFKTPKRHSEINWPLNSNPLYYIILHLLQTVQVQKKWKNQNIFFFIIWMSTNKKYFDILMECHALTFDFGSSLHCMSTPPLTKFWRKWRRGYGQFILYSLIFNFSNRKYQKDS